MTLPESLWAHNFIAGCFRNKWLDGCSLGIVVELFGIFVEFKMSETEFAKCDVSGEMASVA
jgi:hypothetical protein